MPRTRQSKLTSILPSEGAAAQARKEKHVSLRIKQNWPLLPAARDPSKYCQFFESKDPVLSSLGLRVGLGANRLLVGQIGGLGGKWEVFIAGKACEEMSSAERLTNNKQIVCSYNVCSWIRKFKGVGLEGGGLVRFVRHVCPGTCHDEVRGRSTPPPPPHPRHKKRDIQACFKNSVPAPHSRSLSTHEGHSACNGSSVVDRARKTRLEGSCVKHRDCEKRDDP